MDVDHVIASDLDVAKSDAREDDAAVFAPVAILKRVLCHVQTQRHVLRREDSVDQEELADNVADVTDLDEQVDYGEVVTDPVGCNFYF